MGKRLQLETAIGDKDRVLSELGCRNREVLIVQRTLPDVKEVLLMWTSDRSPMIVSVAQGKGWLKVLFATGTTLAFMLTKPMDTSKYSLVVDGVK